MKRNHRAAGKLKGQIPILPEETLRDGYSCWFQRGWSSLFSPRRREFGHIGGPFSGDMSFRSYGRIYIPKDTKSTSVRIRVSLRFIWLPLRSIPPPVTGRPDEIIGLP